MCCDRKKMMPSVGDALCEGRAHSIRDGIDRRTKDTRYCSNGILSPHQPFLLELIHSLGTFLTLKASFKSSRRISSFGTGLRAKTKLLLPCSVFFAPHVLIPRRPYNHAFYMRPNDSNGFFACQNTATKRHEMIHQYQVVLFQRIFDFLNGNFASLRRLENHCGINVSQPTF